MSQVFARRGFWTAVFAKQDTDGAQTSGPSNLRELKTNERRKLQQKASFAAAAAAASTVCISPELCP